MAERIGVREQAILERLDANPHRSTYAEPGESRALNSLARKGLITRMASRGRIVVILT